MLSDLITDTSVLLNDQNFSFTSKPQLIRWINEARRNLAKRTGCVRRLVTGQSAFGASAQPGVAVPGALQPGALPGASQSINGAAANSMMTIPGVERYPYVGFFNNYLRDQYAGCDEIIDTLACSVNWGGTNRPSLDWMPWDDLQAYARAWSVLNVSFPSVWSVYNDGPQGEIWLYPIPSQPGEIELDCFVTPKRIYTDDDFDAIPDGFQEALKFGAASLAFMSSMRYANAQVMEDQFADNIGVARVAVDRGKTRSYYWTAP
jgi:hypothetical protein